MRKLIIALILFTTGCWNYHELDDYAVASSMAIDYVDNQYQVSLLIANGKQTSETQADISIVSGYGTSIYSAIQNIELVNTKKISLNHMSLLVISEEVGHRGIENIVDLSLRNYGQNFYFLVARGQPAAEIISTPSTLTNHVSEHIVDSIKSSEKQHLVANSNFKDFVKKYFEAGIEPITNGIKIRDGHIEIFDIAVFQEGKMIGWLEETNGMNILLKKPATIPIRVECEGGYAVTSITNTDIKFEVSMMSIKIITNSIGNVTEVTCDSVDYTSLAKKTEKELRDDIQRNLNNIRYLGVDLFGFGSIIYKNYPNKNYDNVAMHIDFDVQVSFDFRANQSWGEY